MTLLEWIVPLLLGAVALTAMAGRLGVPYPAFLAAWRWRCCRTDRS